MGKGYIYKISNNQDDYCYVGHTITSLDTRYSAHKHDYLNKKINSCSSKIIFDKYGLENCKIELIKEVEVEDLREILDIETKYIHLLNTCNVMRPTPPNMVEMFKVWKEFKKINHGYRYLTMQWFTETDDDHNEADERGMALVMEAFKQYIEQTDQLDMDKFINYFTNFLTEKMKPQLVMRNEALMKNLTQANKTIQELQDKIKQLEK